MAHFAEIKNNIVTRVLVVDNSQEHRGQDYLANELGLGGTWIQTSYNGNFKKQYAGVGYTYDLNADVFIQPQPYPSWLLNADYDWVAPVPYPQDGEYYEWDEANLNWIEVS